MIHFFFTFSTGWFVKSINTRFSLNNLEHLKGCRFCLGEIAKERKSLAQVETRRHESEKRDYYNRRVVCVTVTAKQVQRVENSDRIEEIVNCQRESAKNATQKSLFLSHVLRSWETARISIDPLFFHAKCINSPQCSQNLVKKKVFMNFFFTCIFVLMIFAIIDLLSYHASFSIGLQFLNSVLSNHSNHDYTRSNHKRNHKGENNRELPCGHHGENNTPETP